MSRNQVFPPKSNLFQRLLGSLSQRAWIIHESEPGRSLGRFILTSPSFFEPKDSK